MVYMGAVICAGEALFDMISQERGNGIGGTTSFMKRIGGSPFNVCIGVSELGEEVSFFSGIGDDSFGQVLLDFMRQKQINMNNTAIQKRRKTSLAFVAVDHEGKAEYEFYRNGTADVALTEAFAEQVDLTDVTLFHFGSLAILDQPGAKAYLRLFERAKGSGITTTFDPNVRPLYIENKSDYVKLIKDIVERVDVLKLSDEDLEYLTGEKDVRDAVDALPKNEDRLEFITLGKEGSLIHYNEQFEQIPGYKVAVKDTVGCGDSYMAGLIKSLNDMPENGGRFELMRKAASFASACSGLVATKEGAATSMPSEKEVRDFMARNQ